MAKKRFESVSGKSAKFWEIEQKGKSHTVTYGRIGTEGRSVTKEFESVARARNSTEILIEQKLKKGYRLAKKTGKGKTSKKVVKKTAAKKASRKTKVAAKKKTPAKKAKARTAIRLSPAELKKLKAGRAAKSSKAKKSSGSVKQRHQQLVKKCGAKLERSISKLLPDTKAAIDFMMFYPPEEDGWINVLAEVDREEWPWDFELLKKDWALPAERRRKSTPDDLYPALLKLFQTAWKKAVGRKKIKAFMRIHEDNQSVDLATGRKIADNRRADVQANRTIRPYKKKKARRRRKVEPTGLKLGWSLKKVSSYLKPEEEIVPTFPGFHMEDRGLMLMFDKMLKLRGFNASPPFDQSIDGIQFGMHVTDVEKVHGLPAVESYWNIKVGKKRTSRRWEYPDRGLYVSFDSADDVLFIQHSQDNLS